MKKVFLILSVFVCSFTLANSTKNEIAGSNKEIQELPYPNGQFSSAITIEDYYGTTIDISVCGNTQKETDQKVLKATSSVLQQIDC